MLDFDTALGLLNKYGYTSISVHPYVYQNGKSIGICYTYVDEDYGELERIRIFENAEELEEFLKKYNWCQNNAKKYHVRMILDNYESINPKTIYLRNEKIMVEGEMFDIDNYDSREAQRDLLDDVSKVIYEAGDLLLVYDEIKSRQLKYLKNIVALKNELRTKYFELQKEVDSYNKYKVERNLTLLPDVTDLGINETMEIAIKDKYNMYVSVRPSYEEAVSFLKEIWEFILTLELNTKFYEAQKEENDVRNETKVVEQKIALMQKLNENIRPLFGVDLVSRFRKINRTCKDESSSISNESIQDSIADVKRKYSVFEKLDILNTSDYLREAIQNTNYADLALKYSKDSKIEIEAFSRKPLNEVAANLTIQYKEKLDINEQAILVLYNNRKFRKLFDVVLNIEDFENLPIKQIVKKLGSIKNFSKIKSECYDSVRKRIDDPINATIKQVLFTNYDFTTFDTFVASFVNELKRLKHINNKMTIDGNINMYLMVQQVEDVSNKKFVMVTNDLNSLYVRAKESNEMIGITLLKAKTPVLYSPYYFDLGDIYSKDASPQMTINEMINFELLIETTDIIINIDPNKVNVVKYNSIPNIVGNLSVVDDIKKYSKTTFCKFAFNSSLLSVPTPVSSSVVEHKEVVSIDQSNSFENDVNHNVEMVVPVSEESLVMPVAKEETTDSSQTTEENTSEIKEVKEEKAQEEKVTPVEEKVTEEVKNNDDLVKNETDSVTEKAKELKKEEEKVIPVQEEKKVSEKKANSEGEKSAEEDKNSKDLVKTENDLVTKKEEEQKKEENVIVQQEEKKVQESDIKEEAKNGELPVAKKDETKVTLNKSVVNNQKDIKPVVVNKDGLSIKKETPVVPVSAPKSGELKKDINKNVMHSRVKPATNNEHKVPVKSNVTNVIKPESKMNQLSKATVNKTSGNNENSIMKKSVPLQNNKLNNIVKTNSATTSVKNSATQLDKKTEAVSNENKKDVTIKDDRKEI